MLEEQNIISPFQKFNAGKQDNKRAVTVDPENDEYTDETLPKAYLSTTYYKSKNEFVESIFSNKKNDVLFQVGGGPSPQIQFISEQQMQKQFQQAFQQPSQQQHSIEQQFIQANNILNQQQQQQQQFQQNDEFPQDNAYLNFAMKMRPNYDINSEVIDKIEQKTIIENFLEKRAKRHIQENYQKLKQILNEESLKSINSLSKIAYTYENPNKISQLLGGLTPNSIQDLKKGSSTYKLFQNDLEISPKQKLNFEDMEILIPKMEIITIQNKNKKNSIIISEIFASSPEISFYFDSNNSLQHTLLPLQSIQIRVVYIPETYGSFDCVIYFIVNSSQIFMELVSAKVNKNQYGLEPVYLNDVVLTDKTATELPIEVINQMSNEYLIIKEMYSTEDFLQLKWPNGVEITEKIEVQNIQDSSLSQFLKINPVGRKQIATATFNGTQYGDFVATVHLLTSLNDIIRVPFNFHVNSDPIKFIPELIDFGVIGMLDEQLKVTIKLKIKSNYDTFMINDIFVPIDDDRLDFQIPDPKKINQGKQLKKSVNNQEILLGSIFLTPQKGEGLIDSKIIIIIQTQQQSQNIIRIEIPIIGLVLNSSSILISNQTQINKIDILQNSQQGQQQQQPVVMFDISEYLINEGVVLFKPQFKDGFLSQNLIITNTFNQSIFIRDIINSNSEFKLNILPEIKSSFIKQSQIPISSLNFLPVSTFSINQNQSFIYLNPGESLKLGTIELQTQNLKMAQGQKLISLQINNTLVSMSVHIYDRNLLCQWEEDFGQLKFIQCSAGYDLNFGNIALNEPKKRRMNITNLNPIDIMIDSIVKSQNDDLVIYIERIVHKNGQVLKQFDTPNFENINQQQNSNNMIIISPKKQKNNNQKLKILSQYIYSFVFVVNAKEAKSKSGRVDFVSNEMQTKDFSFNYQYQSNEGSLILIPSSIQFNPAFPGMLQFKNITISSTFNVNIIIKHMACNDMRIMPAQYNPVILANNKTDVGQVHFDPGKTQHNQIKEIDLLNLFNQQMPNVDPILQANLINFFQQQSQSQQILTNQGVNQFQINQIKGNQNGPQNLQVQQQGASNNNGPAHNLPQKTVITPISIHDIIQHQEKQKFWDRIGTSGKSEIVTILTIETNVIEKIELPIKASLMKPTIVIEDQIDFETVQIGTHVMKNIKIVNPSEETLLLQLFLAGEQQFKMNSNNNNTNDNNNNNKNNGGMSDFQKGILKLLRINNGKVQNSKDDNQTSENDFDEDQKQKQSSQNHKNTNERENYLVLYCSHKIKYGIHEEKLASIDITELLVNSKINMLHLCLTLLDIADDYTIESIKLDYNLKSQLEPFFRELYLQEYGSQDQIQATWTKTNNPNQNPKNGQQNKQTTININIPLNNPAQQELMAQVEQILFQTSLKPADYMLMKGMTKGTQSHQRNIFEFFIYEAILEPAKKIFKYLFQPNNNNNNNNLSNSNNNNTNINANYNQSTNQQNLKQQQQQQYSNQQSNAYKLKNYYLNEIIINNNTNTESFYQQTDNIQQQQQQQFFQQNLASQSFYINPKFQGITFKVEPKSNFTITDALVFQPINLQQPELQMTLLIKNNLTILYPVELKGSGGTGLIEFIKVSKKFNANNEQEKLEQNNIFNQENIPFHEKFAASSFNIHQSDIRDGIITFIYGDQQCKEEFQQPQQQPSQLNVNNSNNNNNINNVNETNQIPIVKCKQNQDRDNRVIPFAITLEDLIQNDEKSPGQNMDITSFIDKYQDDFSSLEQQLSISFLKENSLKINNFHQRVLVAQNTGNLPVQVDSISIEGKGCEAYGFQVVNCNSFILQPGQLHYLQINFISDFSIALFRKKLVLESKHFTQEFILQVQIPIKFLQIAHQIAPLNQLEEYIFSYMQVIIILLSGIIVISIIKDILSHIQYQKLKQLSESKNQLQNELSNKKKELKVLQNCWIKNKKGYFEQQQHIFKDILNFSSTDQIFSQYQHTSDRFDLNNTNSQQILLKEIGNVCAKKNMVILEAQKQALDAEKERRNQNRMTMNKYLEEKSKEDSQQQNQQNLKDMQSVKENKKDVQEKVNIVIDKKQQHQTAGVVQGDSNNNKQKKDDSNIKKQQQQQNNNDEFEQLKQNEKLKQQKLEQVESPQDLQQEQELLSLQNINSHTLSTDIQIQESPQQQQQSIIKLKQKKKPSQKIIKRLKKEENARLKEKELREQQQLLLQSKQDQSKQDGIEIIENYEYQDQDQDHDKEQEQEYQNRSEKLKYINDKIQQKKQYKFEDKFENISEKSVNKINQEHESPIIISSNLKDNLQYKQNNINNNSPIKQCGYQLNNINNEQQNNNEDHNNVIINKNEEIIPQLQYDNILINKSQDNIVQEPKEKLDLKKQNQSETFKDEVVTIEEQVLQIIEEPLKESFENDNVSSGDNLSANQLNKKDDQNIANNNDTQSLQEDQQEDQVNQQNTESNTNNNLNNTQESSNKNQIENNSVENNQQIRKGYLVNNQAQITNNNYQYIKKIQSNQYQQLRGQQQQQQTQQQYSNTYQKSRVIPPSSIVQSIDQNYYQKRNVNPTNSFYQGRGNQQQQQQSSYVRRGGSNNNNSNVQYNRQTNNYIQQEDENQQQQQMFDKKQYVSYSYQQQLQTQQQLQNQQPQQEQQQLQSSFNTQNQQSTGPKRIVINTLKNQNIQQPFKYRGKGNQYYKQDDDDQPYYKHYTYSVPYQKKQRDEYDDDQQVQRDQYKYNIKKDYRASQEGNYNDEENEQDYSFQEDIHEIKNKKVYEEDQKDNMSFKSFVNELENQNNNTNNNNNNKRIEKIESKSKDLQNENLSKDELQPFFERKKQKESDKELKVQGNNKNINQNSGSLYTFQNFFNPNSTNIINDQDTIQNKIQSEEYQKQQREKQETKEQQEETQRKVDFYNIFKSANSIFKPGFGASKEEKGQIQHISQNSNENSDLDNSGGFSGGQSLFSKTLFGGQPLFGQNHFAQTRDKQENFGGFQKQQYGYQKEEKSYSNNQDVDFENEEEDQIRSQDKFKRQTDSYSLFGNMSSQFSSGYQPNNNNSNNNQKGQFWNSKHYQEDEERKNQ